MIMNPEELIDSRAYDAPLALWHNMIVQSTHHDGADPMPTELKDFADRLVFDVLFGSTKIEQATIAPDATHWLTTNWN